MVAGAWVYNRPMDRIPLLDLKLQFASIREEVDRVLHRVVESQLFILGSEVADLEKELAAYTGARHAIGCASGTDALILALRALGVRAGDEVVTTPFSFFASASCAALLGARPVFVDIERGSFNIDPSKIEEAITPRTKALLPVHLFGQCADIDAIGEIGSRRGLPIVEDACQSIGATYASRREGSTRGAGCWGAAGAFSFFPSKNLGGFGDGGLVTTGDDDLAATIRVLRVHGERERYKHQAIGWNSRLDALQAAVLRVKLPRLDAWHAARAANAERYDRSFVASGLVASEAIAIPARAGGGRHVFNQYTIRARDRDALARHMDARGIGTGIYYPIPLHLQECFVHLGYRPGDLPEAERASREVLSLPIFPELTAAQIGTVAGLLKAGLPTGSTA